MLILCAFFRILIRKFAKKNSHMSMGRENIAGHFVMTRQRFACGKLNTGCLSCENKKKSPPPPLFGEFETRCFPNGFRMQSEFVQRIRRPQCVCVGGGGSLLLPREGENTQLICHALALARGARLLKKSGCGDELKEFGRQKKLPFPAKCALSKQHATSTFAYTIP